MSRFYTVFFYLTLTLASQLLCGALLWVARSSQGVAAAETLPVVVLVLVGWLFAGGTYALGRGFQGRPLTRLMVLGTALALNALAAWVAPVPPSFVVAPTTAIVLGEFLRVFGRRAPMLAAMSVYVVCTLLANFTFDSFLALPVYGQLSVGTLFFGVTFTQRDRVHSFGKGRVYAMIAVAAIANLALSAYLGIPLRFLLAGFLAILLAEAADTEVYGRIHKGWWLRVATSNAVSIPLDSLVFTLIAFAGTLSAAAVGEIVFADVLAKTVVGLLAAVRLAQGRSPRPLRAAS